jgi:ribosomal protein S14
MAREVLRDDRRPAGTRESRCARCGAPFHCGIDDPGGCWCAKLPPLPREAYAAEVGCLCEKCLREAARTPGP